MNTLAIEGLARHAPIVVGLVFLAVAGCENSLDSVENFRKRSDLVIFCVIEGKGENAKLVFRRTLYSRSPGAVPYAPGAEVETGLTFDRTGNWEGAVIAYERRSGKMMPWTMLGVRDGIAFQDLSVDEFSRRLAHLP